jgi:hypothetical protein
VKLVRDRVGEWRAEHRDRRREHDFRLVTAAGATDRFQQRAGAVEIDVVALLEIGFRFARHHSGEMENNLRPAGDQLCRSAGRGKVAGRQFGLAGETRGLFRRHDVGQRQTVDRLAVELSVLDEPRGELAADHSRRAGDQNVHLCPRFKFVRRFETVDATQVGEY